MDKIARISYWNNFLSTTNVLLKEEDEIKYRYEAIVPNATYSPWRNDAEFLRVYDKVNPYTLVDIYRCYELWMLVKEASKLNNGAFIEIGVWRGGSGALIAKRAALLGIQEPVYLCDTFTGVVKASEKDSRYHGGEHNDTSLDNVKKILKELEPLPNVKILKGIFPEDTEKDVTTENIRFCHIDVDVYRSAVDIVDWLWDKLVIGGIIVYDDYGFKGCDGITTHVNEQILVQDRLVIHNLNGHAIVIKIGNCQKTS